MKSELEGAEMPRGRREVAPSRTAGSIRGGRRLADELLAGEHGVTTVEYALVLALVAVTCLSAVTLLVNAISGAYQRVSTALH